MATDARFEELKKRLVAPGQPTFSCSEFHELYDFIEQLQGESTCNSCGKSFTGCTNSDCDASIG